MPDTGEHSPGGSRLAEVTDAEAARMVRPDTVADLAAQITASPPGAAPDRLATARGGGRSVRKGRWLIGMHGQPAPSPSPTGATAARHAPGTGAG